MPYQLFVTHAHSSAKVPVTVTPASAADLAATASGWQTNWKSPAAQDFPNKVALKTVDNQELLGLLSYTCSDRMLAVEVVYLESQPQSNGNLLHMSGQQKSYYGIARALFAYAVQVSLEHGYDGVVFFKAKTDTLLSYYLHEFGARPVSRYDPFRLVLWEDAAQKLLSEYEVTEHE